MSTVPPAAAPDSDPLLPRQADAAQRAPAAGPEERHPGGSIPGYGWPAALAALAVAVAAMLALYWPGVQKLVHIWLNSETYAHGMVIVPIALYLAWTRRAALAAIRPRPSLWGLPLLALLGFGWFAARTVDVTVVQTFVVVALLPVLTLTVLGTAAARVLVFPLGFLFFAWPVGSFLVPILQDYTAWFSMYMLKLSGIPTYLEGRFISIPSGNFVVADVCSGIRYLIASVAVGCVYAYLMYSSIWRRLAFIALAIALPVIANGLRAYGIIMIAHWTDMEYAVGVDHLIYGWVFFLFVMMLLFWIGGRFREPKAPAALRQGVAGTAPLKAGAAAGPLVAAAVVLALGPVGDGWMSLRAATLDGGLQPLAPQALHWSGPGEPLDDWRPMYAEPDTLVRAAYRQDDAAVGVYLLHYRHRAQGSDLIRYDNRIPDDVIWRRASESSRSVSLPQGGMHEVREIVMRGHDGVSRVVWYWYQVGGTATAHPITVKLLEAWAKVRGDEEGSLLVAVVADYQVSAAEARERLTGFIADAGVIVAFAEEDAP